MALTATASQGFEWVREVEQGEVLWVASDPGDTLTRGDLVTFSVGEGIADLIASDETPMGVVLETVVSPALTTGFPYVQNGAVREGWGQVPSAELKSLVAIRPLVPVGTPILKATFASHFDDTVISYTAATPQVALTTGMTADDYPNGGLVYVYEGAGAGQFNVVADYDHTGGAAELMLVFHRKFQTAVDSTSKMIIVAGEGASNKGIGFFGRCVPGDQNNLVANNGADDGDFTVFLDARSIGAYLGNLMLPVIQSTHIGLFA